MLYTVGQNSKEHYYDDILGGHEVPQRVGSLNCLIGYGPLPGGILWPRQLISRCLATELLYGELFNARWELFRLQRLLLLLRYRWDEMVLLLRGCPPR